MVHLMFMSNAVYSCVLEANSPERLRQCNPNGRTPNVLLAIG